MTTQYHQNKWKMDVDDPMVSKKHDSMRQEEERAHRATHTDDSDAVAISLNISKATTKQSLVRNVPSIKSWWCWFPNHGMFLPCCGSSQALVWFWNLGTFQAAAHHLAPRSPRAFSCSWVVQPCYMAGSPSYSSSSSWFLWLPTIAKYIAKRKTTLAYSATMHFMYCMCRRFARGKMCVCTYEPWKSTRARKIPLLSNFHVLQQVLVQVIHVMILCTKRTRKTSFFHFKNIERDSNLARLTLCSLFSKL